MGTQELDGGPEQTMGRKILHPQGLLGKQISGNSGAGCLVLQGVRMGKGRVWGRSP